MENNFEKLFVNQIDTLEEEIQNIKKISNLFAETIKNKGIIHMAALENDKEFLMELCYRAGGLVPFHKIDYLNLVLKNKISYLQYLSMFKCYDHSFTQLLLNMYNIQKNDIFIVIYNGKYSEIIAGLIIELKKRNYKIVLLSSFQLLEEMTSRENVFSLALDKIDYFIDNHIKDNLNMNYDILVDDRKMLQTITNNIIAQMITLETYNSLKELNYPVHVFLSENVPNSDEYNLEITKDYDGRWNS